MRRSLFLTPFLILPLLAAGPAQAQKEAALKKGLAN